MFVDCRKTFSLLVKFLTDKWSFKTSGSWFQRVLALCLIHFLPINYRKRRSKFFLTPYLRIDGKLINILPGVHFAIRCSDITIAEGLQLFFLLRHERLIQGGRKRAAYLWRSIVDFCYWLFLLSRRSRERLHTSMMSICLSVRPLQKNAIFSKN